MIGFEKKPTGRMGNVLIQYVFLRQIAEKTGLDYFHPVLPYEQYFEGFKAKRRTLREFFKPKWIVSNSHIKDVGVEQFINEVKEKKDYSIILKPPVLGHLLEWHDENQMRFIRVKEECADNTVDVANDERKKIGIHFRATDFREWDANAVLDFAYYKAGIDYVLDQMKESNPLFLLFTDENEFDTYRQTISYLEEKGLDYVAGDAKRPMMRDFVGLSECDVIISSPSTFAICATLYGKENKKIIHSKKWVDYCINRDEEFWKTVQENENQYYDTVVL